MRSFEKSFFALPVELRFWIYKLAFIEDQPIRVPEEYSTGWPLELKFKHWATKPEEKVEVAVTAAEEEEVGAAAEAEGVDAVAGAGAAEKAVLPRRPLCDTHVDITGQYQTIQRYFGDALELYFRRNTFEVDLLMLPSFTQDLRDRKIRPFITRVWVNEGWGEISFCTPFGIALRQSLPDPIKGREGVCDRCPPGSDDCVHVPRFKNLQILGIKKEELVLDDPRWDIQQDAGSFWEEIDVFGAL